MRNKIKILPVLLAAMFLGAVSCTEIYEESYPHLKLSSTEYTLSSEGGTFEFMVYYSSSWTAALSSDTSEDWVDISRTSAAGQAYIRVNYNAAVSHARSATIQIKADNGDTATVTLKQEEAR